jgi:hypothetical protein
MSRKPRYVDPEGYALCPGVEGQIEGHAGHLTEFYTKDPADGYPVRWTDPSGKEYGSPSTRCRGCTVKWQQRYNKTRAAREAQRKREEEAEKLALARRAIVHIRPPVGGEAEGPDPDPFEDWTDEDDAILEAINEEGRQGR